MSTTPLTDAINALTTYSNETTGESDTTLSAAVATLVAGYGGGGGYSAHDILYGTAPSGAVSITADGTIPARAISGRTAITSLTIDLSGGYSMSGYSITDNTFGSSVHIIGHSTFTVPSYLLTSNGNSSNTFILVVEDSGHINSNGFRANSGLKVLDYSWYGGAGTIQGSAFYQDSVLDTIIIRSSAVFPLGNVNAFIGTPFASGGSGGTIYVPSDLISSYQSASNWSTLHGYGTVTWTAIEGSQYETQYADGTAIS